VVILSDEDDRVIGLPGYARFREKEKRRRALLKKIDSLGIPAVTDAIKHYRSHPAYGDQIFTFKSGGQSWWAIVRPFYVDTGRVMRITVVVPEVDLLGSLKLMWLWILLIILGIFLLAVKRIFTLTGRYSRPIENLVQESRRIAHGNLEPGPAIDSQVEEFQRLARAHDEMRRGLRVLLKMERDVQIARHIQQDTLPRRLPVLPGYQIIGWSEPAEGAAGDTFDVIGFVSDSRGEGIRISEESADGAIFLLADASGHGIGPALSVTQVRAMLRMAVRSGEDLMGIIRFMNEQLMEDLHEGRFITAWFAELDPATHRLTSFSLGQAPLLHYRAREGDCRSLLPQLPPFGTIDEIGDKVPQVIPLAAGDIFVVLSDGLFEPRNAEGRMFGKKRVMEIIRARHRETPEKILEAIREDIDRFTENAAADDDRTAVIIKRKRHGGHHHGKGAGRGGKGAG
jgi:serine phosphatase RsbU (regulator of sigma subunit)